VVVTDGIVVSWIKKIRWRIY